ncbi:hypothetical protein GJ744_003833 [Endocarpon pusillum]|uniref:Uncharacterized protein n=1 Tax=Endocarpon pusillum TaxID=364733 RepID=A0A8H7AV33_9EURO|nr:hypothetical protein GJ744_003833 [Endocarpon pusillum]
MPNLDCVGIFAIRGRRRYAFCGFAEVVQRAAKTEKNVFELFEIFGCGASTGRQVAIELVCQLADQNNISDAKAERHAGNSVLTSFITFAQSSSSKFISDVVEEASHVDPCLS